MPGADLMPLGDRFPFVLSAAGAGDEQAWAELYHEFAPGLLRFIVNQGAHDPEDCLGECFVQVVRNLPEFIGGEPVFRGWLFQVARNRVVDSWRAARRRPVTPTDDLTAVERPAPGQEQADTRLAGRDAVEDVLSHLSPDHRAVVALRVLEEFSVEETARILHRSPGAVRVLQHRAIKSLRRALSERHGGQGSPVASDARTTSGAASPERPQLTP